MCLDKVRGQYRYRAKKDTVVWKVCRANYDESISRGKTILRTGCMGIEISKEFVENKTGLLYGLYPHGSHCYKNKDSAHDHINRMTIVFGLRTRVHYHFSYFIVPTLIPDGTDVTIGKDRHGVVIVTPRAIYDIDNKEFVCEITA